MNSTSHYRRNSNRLSGYDYSEPGAYFVTLIAHQRECLFGDVIAGRLIYSPMGQILEMEWLRLPARFSFVRLDAFVVMPDHLHAVLWIDEPCPPLTSGRGEASGVSYQTNRPDASLALSDEKRPAGQPAHHLGTVIGAFKSTTTRLINQSRGRLGSPVWQRNYHDRIIRSETELERIIDYIRCNPENWETDREDKKSFWV